MDRKTVLVTGADGFIGSHLVEQLLKEGFHVRALVQYNSLGSWGWIDGLLSDRLEVIGGDITDSSVCELICKNISHIYHLAALIAIPYSYMATNSYINTNITGTLNLCKAALNNGVTSFIQTSTSEVYGTAIYTPIDERHTLQAQSPYSASKIGSDAIAYSMYTSFNLPLKIIRPFNVFGPRQSARAVIPTIISQILRGEKKIKLGDVTTFRDFNYVKNTCNAFIRLQSLNDGFGEVFNVGSGEAYSVKDIAYKIADKLNVKIEIEQDSSRMRPEASEVRMLLCDNSKAFEWFGYEPKIKMDEGLVRTIEWFSEENNLSRYKEGYIK